jgi:hypothetical protein
VEAQYAEAVNRDSSEKLVEALTKKAQVNADARGVKHALWLTLTPLSGSCVSHTHLFLLGSFSLCIWYDVSAHSL